MANTTQEQKETFSCMHCGGEGLNGSMYNEHVYGVTRSTCQWCNGTGEVDEHTFNEQWEIYEE